MKYVFRIIPGQVFLALVFAYGHQLQAVKADIHTLVKLPPGFAVTDPHVIEWREESYTLSLYARGFKQGEAVYMEITAGSSKMPKIKKCYFQNRTVYLNAFKWGYRGFFALPPGGKTGTCEIKLISESKGSEQQNVYTIKVSPGNFPVFHHKLDLGKYSNLSYLSRPDIAQRIRECAKKKKEVFLNHGPDMLGPGLSHPRDMHYVTSPFWAKRYYYAYRVNKGKKIKINTGKRIHRGIDLRGEKGTPVYAIADGWVALAEEMFYEGNLVVLDHGNRIFSYYMHQDTLAVKKGQKVRGGDLIGTVGSTGVSTAAHLHVSLVINGVQADPLSLLWLPIRN